MHMDARDIALKALLDRADAEAFTSDHERTLYHQFMRGLMTRDELGNELGWPAPTDRPRAIKRAKPRLRPADMPKRMPNDTARFTLTD